MKFSDFGGTVLVPTLGRVVLGATFITSGWSLCFGTTTYSPEDVQKLKEMGQDLAPSNSVTVLVDPIIHPASYQDDVVEGAADEAGDDSAGDDAQPAGSTDTGDASGDAEADVVLGDPVDARRVHGLMLHLYGCDMNEYAWWLAWSVAILQLGGGVLLLVGLFTRLWALGLTVVLGAAIYLVSVQQHGMLDVSPLDWIGGGHRGQYWVFMGRSGLLVLALGLVFTGAGPLSLDRMLFRSGPAAPESPPGS